MITYDVIIIFSLVPFVIEYNKIQQRWYVVSLNQSIIIIRQGNTTTLQMYLYNYLQLFKLVDVVVVGKLSQTVKILPSNIKTQCSKKTKYLVNRYKKWLESANSFICYITVANTMELDEVRFHPFHLPTLKRSTSKSSDSLRTYFKAFCQTMVVAGQESILSVYHHRTGSRDPAPGKTINPGLVFNLTRDKSFQTKCPLTERGLGATLPRLTHFKRTRPLCAELVRSRSIGQ